MTTNLPLGDSKIPQIFRMHPYIKDVECRKTACVLESMIYITYKVVSTDLTVTLVTGLLKNGANARQALIGKVELEHGHSPC